jgi:hypothetical protein
MHPEAASPLTRRPLVLAANPAEVVMALRYLGQAEAERLMAATFTEWVGAYKYSGCVSADQTEEAVVDAFLWAVRGGSITATEQHTFVNESTVEICVIGMKGGFQCFGSNDVGGRPGIFIGVEGRLKYAVRGPHQLHIPPEAMTARPDTLPQLDNKIALLHEFGHAKQFIERPEWFAGHYKKADANRGPARKFTNPVDPLPMAPARSVTVAGSATPGATSFPEAIQKRAAEVHAKAGRTQKAQWVPVERDTSDLGMDFMKASTENWLATEEDVKAVAKFQYGLRVESDNMARHEWPICDELGIPRRLNYRDLVASTPGTAQTDTVLQRLGQITGQRAAPSASVRLATTGKLNTKVECPRCHNMVRSQALDKPCDNLLHN